MRLRVMIFFSVCVWAANALAAEAYRVGVDPRVELMSVLFRLAGNNEYNQCLVPEYDKALERYFSAYRDHEAVQLARKLRLGFDAPMSLAVHLTDVKSLAERVPFDRPGIRLDRRWDVGKARDFLKAARKFVADTKFIDFLESQKSLYAATDDRLKAFVTKADLEWYSTFFGTRSAVRLIIVPGMANGGPSYGPAVIAEDGALEIYAIPGVTEVDADGSPKFGSDWRDAMVHEFVHSYSNPLVDRFSQQMEKAALKLYGPVEGAMRSQAYASWKTMLHESLVRAATVRYVLEHDGPEAATRMRHGENARSFLWVGELSDLFGEYEKSRQAYPTFESFMPKVVEFFDEVAPRIDDLMRRYDESRPKALSTSISMGAEDIDPNLTQITIQFDMPMIRTRYAIARTSSDQTKFPKLGKPQFDESGTLLVLPVNLEPNHEYQFAIGSLAASQNLAPIKRAIYFQFRTKATPDMK